MIKIEVLREYYIKDKVLISEHAAYRFKQRNIKAKEVRYAVNNGEIIEQYPEDYPFPSCLILGKTSEGKPLHIVMSDEGTMSRVITVYYPDKDKWTDDFRARKGE